MKNYFRILGCIGISLILLSSFFYLVYLVDANGKLRQENALYREYIDNIDTCKTIQEVLAIKEDMISELQFIDE